MHRQRNKVARIYKKKKQKFNVEIVVSTKKAEKLSYLNYVCYTVCLLPLLFSLAYFCKKNTVFLQFFTLLHFYRGQY